MNKKKSIVAIIESACAMGEKLALLLKDPGSASLLEESKKSITQFQNSIEQSEIEALKAPAGKLADFDFANLESITARFALYEILAGIKSLLDVVTEDEQSLKKFETAFRDFVFKDISKSYGALLPALKKHRDTVFAGEEEAASGARIDEILGEIDLYLVLAGASGPTRELTLTMRDMFASVAAGSFSCDDRIMPLAVKSAKLSWQSVNSDFAGKSEVSAREIACFLAELRQTLKNIGVPVHEPDFDQSIDILTSAGIKKELLKTVSPDNMPLLMEKFESGKYLYQITVDTESDEDFTNRFVDWVRGNTESITSRTIIIRSKSWFEFLLASPMPPDKFGKSLGELDTTGSMILFENAAVRKSEDGATQD